FPAELDSFTVYGGSGGNTFAVTNPGPEAVTLQPGAGNNTVNVTAEQGGLNIVTAGGNVAVNVGSKLPSTTGDKRAGSKGLVSLGPPPFILSEVTPPAGTASLSVYDDADSAAHNVSVVGNGGDGYILFNNPAEGDLTGLAPADISWASFVLTALNI